MAADVEEVRCFEQSSASLLQGGRANGSGTRVLWVSLPSDSSYPERITT